jgi:hypothetical protein
LRTILVIALLVGVFVLAMVAVENLTKDRSATVTIAASIAVVIVGTLAMIFGIQAVSTPKAARLVTALPPDAKLLHFHRQKVYRWAKILGGIVAAFAVPGLLIPGDIKYVPLSVAGVALFLTIILLPVMYVTSRNLDRSLTALEHDPWVHWRYPPAQWQDWVTVQVDRAKAVPLNFSWKSTWKKLALPFAGIAVGVIFFSPGPLWAKLLYVIGCCGAITGLVAWSARDERRAPDKLRARLQASDPEVYFGHDGIFGDNEYTTWLSLNIYLLSATIDERPPRSLLFKFEKVIPGAYSNQIVQVAKNVLIPAGGEQDIARLQRELSNRCPKARIALA